jgi:hypothetical protein
MDDGDSTKYEGPNGAFATQTFSYTLLETGVAGAAVMHATVSAAVSNGGFVLPKTQGVVHSIEVRGRRTPDSATFEGEEMVCITVQGSEHTLARPAGTVVCRAAMSIGLGEGAAAELRWN